MPKDIGAARTLIANHVVVAEIKMLAMRLRPVNSRKNTADTNGATAVATRACGVRFSRNPLGSTP